MDNVERWWRRWRNLDSFVSSKLRKYLIICLVAILLLLYLGPPIYRWMFSAGSFSRSDLAGWCLRERLYPFDRDIETFDVAVNSRHHSLDVPETSYLPFVGNGRIGITLDPAGVLYVRYQRTLNVEVPYHPLVKVSLDGIEPKEAVITQYTSGVVHRFSCFQKAKGCVDAQITYYAYRPIPSIFVQDIKLTNPLENDVYFDLDISGKRSWIGTEQTRDEVTVQGQAHSIDVISGTISGKSTHSMFTVLIATTRVPKNTLTRGRSSESLTVLSSIQYAEQISQDSYREDIKDLLDRAKNELAAALATRRLKDKHIQIWSQFWKSGFSISYSKASDALNGDKINATIYYVLSHSRAYLHEEGITEARLRDLRAHLVLADRCYDGIHTLQAQTLWSDLHHASDVERVVSLWKLTLLKQGCQLMLSAGADGVVQAMVLSFGGLRFRNHHLEFNIHPKHLHRDKVFRYIRYGNRTALSVSVTVGEDNKAVLGVILHESEKKYFACDGGCLDPPIQLDSVWKQLPVKLTDPITPILYITPEEDHINDLKHTLHFKDVVEAPAHEHHVIALHRHGHHLGGLPTLFWVSIAFLVLVFHLFLFKLIYNEYCHSQDKVRARYAL